MNRKHTIQGMRQGQTRIKHKLDGFGEKDETEKFDPRQIPFLAR
jgi:hypothetical protein